MTVTLKFLGSLRHASGEDKLSVECEGSTSVLDLVNQVARKNSSLRRNLLDEQLEKPKPNALILVNGREISVLKGLETKVKDGDEVIFVPIVHGG